MKKASITLSNEETLLYIEKGKRSYPALILVHGNMSSGVHYTPIIDLLAKQYYVIAPDLRGFGDSSYKTPIESLDDFADDLADFMRAKSIPRAHIAGWSTGGGIGLKFAAKYPQLINKLILIESASYRGYPIYKKDANYQPILSEIYQNKLDMAKDPVQVAPVAKALEDNDATFMKNLWKMAIYNVKTPDDHVFDNYIKESLKQRNLIDLDWALVTFNMSDKSNGVSQGDGSIKDVTCDVLSIYGLKDRAILRSMFDETVDALKNVRVHIFKDAGHSPITDCPNELVDVMCDFLK